MVSKFKLGFGAVSPSELRNIQSHLLELLLEFDSICNKHGIRYYLDGGSVIGALRHQGFIPWDDDVDVLMKHEDFERFLSIIDHELCLRENRTLSDMSRDHEHGRSFARYVRTDIPHILRSTTVEANYVPGIFIDIFVLDGVPANALDTYRGELEASEDWYHRRLNGVVGRLAPWKYHWYRFQEGLIGARNLHQKFVRRLSRWAGEAPDYYIPRNGFNYGVYNAGVFQEPRFVNFEGNLLPVPTRPEEYLREHYGIEWYKMPPRQQRESAHWTLTSEYLTTQELLESYDWLAEIDQVQLTKSRDHIHRIRRKPWLDRKSSNLAQIKAIAFQLELERDVDVGHLLSLRERAEFRQLHDELDRLLSTEREISRLNASDHPMELFSPRLLALVVEELCERGELASALKLLGSYDGCSEEVEEYAKKLLDLELRLQDGEILEAKLVAESILLARPHSVPALWAEALLRDPPCSAAELRGLVENAEWRMGGYDRLVLLHANALLREGMVGESILLYEDLSVSSSDGLVVLEATNALAKVNDHE